MTLEERLLCIQKINPNAIFTVWGDGSVRWDDAHVGAKPTLKECEAVLDEVRAEIAKDHADRDKEAAIQAEMAAIVREQAITNLVAKGVLTEADKIG